MMNEQGYQKIHATIIGFQEILTERDKVLLSVFLSKWAENTEGSQIIFQYIYKLIDAKKDKGEKINEGDEYIYALVFLIEAFYEKYKPQLNKKNIISLDLGEMKFDVMNIFSRDLTSSIFRAIFSNIEKISEVTKFKIRYADTDGEEKEIEVTLPKYTGMFYVLSEYIAFASQFEHKNQIKNLLEKIFSQVDNYIGIFGNYRDAFATLAEHATREKYRYGQEKIRETAKQFGVYMKPY